MPAAPGSLASPSGRTLEHVLDDDAAQQLDLFDRAKPNDADRLRKYLARFNLEWDDVAE